MHGPQMREGILFRDVVHIKQIRTLVLQTADGEPQSQINLTHFLGVAADEVIVDGYQVRAFLRKGVEGNRQRCGQRLAFTGLHLSDLALMQGDTADELNIEVAHAQRALGRFASDGETFRQEVV